MRLSRPMACATILTSAVGMCSQMLAMVFMKLIFVASMALLAYLMSSAVASVVWIMGGGLGL